ncbi:hypothetical protein, partial [Streptomyces indiaensis]|uniref:hypothetical protein n=1 Tax=Streptomyces indiaensis TaxID=284033 RepID=UPI0031E038D5
RNLQGQGTDHQADTDANTCVAQSNPPVKERPAGLYGVSLYVTDEATDGPSPPQHDGWHLRRPGSGTDHPHAIICAGRGSRRRRSGEIVKGRRTG